MKYVNGKVDIWYGSKPPSAINTIWQKRIIRNGIESSELLKYNNNTSAWEALSNSDATILEGRVNGLETEHYESTVRIDTLENKTEVLEDGVNTLENDVNLLGNRLDAVIATADMALVLGLDGTQIDAESQARIDADAALQANIDAIEDGFGTLVSRIGELKTEIHESVVRIETLEDKTEVLKDDVSTLESNANLLENRLDAIAAIVDMALVLGLD